VQTVNLSQVPELYKAQRNGVNLIITLYENVIDMSDEENQKFTADMYQIKMPYRKGLLSDDNYEKMLDFAKRLHNPSNATEERQARDVLV
jgi:hypothetical protein